MTLEEAPFMIDCGTEKSTSFPSLSLGGGGLSRTDVELDSMN